MKSKIILGIAALAMSGLVAAQDTTRTPVIEGDPAVRQSPHEIQRSMLQDMVKIPQRQLPQPIRDVIQSDSYRGTKTFYMHRTKEEYAVEVTAGEVISVHLFDKNGKPINRRE